MAFWSGHKAGIKTRCEGVQGSSGPGRPEDTRARPASSMSGCSVSHGCRSAVGIDRMVVRAIVGLVAGRLLGLRGHAGDSGDEERADDGGAEQNDLRMTVHDIFSLSNLTVQFDCPM